MGPVGNGGFYKNIVWTKDGQHGEGFETLSVHRLHGDVEEMAIVLVLEFLV